MSRNLKTAKMAPFCNLCMNDPHIYKNNYFMNLHESERDVNKTKI